MLPRASHRSVGPNKGKDASCRFKLTLKGSTASARLLVFSPPGRARPATQ